MILSKSHPERIYIGSAFDFTLRWMIHRSNLLNHSHHNAKLQNHFDKYGADDLHFVILKICNRSELLKQEQNYIDIFQPYFNICFTAGSRAGTRHSNKTKITLSNKLKRIRKPSRYESLRGRFVKHRL